MTDLRALSRQIKLAAEKWLDPEVQKGLEAQDKPQPMPKLPMKPAVAPKPLAPKPAASSIPYGSPLPKKAQDMNPERNAALKDVPKLLTTIKKAPTSPLDRESAGEKHEKVASHVKVLTRLLGR